MLTRHTLLLVLATRSTQLRLHSLCHTTRDLKRDFGRQTSLCLFSIPSITRAELVDKVDMSIVCQPALVPVLEKGSTQTTGKGEAAWGRRLNKRICLERNQIQARDRQGQALQWNNKAQLRSFLAY